jgi:hypothetical protein
MREERSVISATTFARMAFIIAGLNILTFIIETLSIAIKMRH